jgi:hypothetical protein
MLVALIGDVHDDLGRLHRQVAAAAAAGAGAAIQLGDLGFREEVLGPGRPWPRFPVPVLALCGNHEDHAFLRRARASGLATAWAAHGLCYQARGSVARLGGRTVVFLGGALHTDRPQVREGGNVIGEEDVAATLSACAIHSPDLIATHSCPSGIGVGMRGNPELAYGVAQFVHAAGFDSGPLDDCGEMPLRRVWDGLRRRPAIWAFGHFHVAGRTSVQDTTFVVLPEPQPTAITAWDTASNTLVELA